MSIINLVKIDTNNEEDLLFTYEILEYRFANVDKQQIHYKSRTDLPTYQQHTQQIKTSGYKGLYKIMLENMPIGTIHVNKSDEVGIFFLPALLKKAIKTYKQNNEIPHDYSFSGRAVMALFKMHPEIKRFYCSVNSNNLLSRNSLEKHGFELIEVVYTMESVNGKFATGPYANDD